MIEDLQARAQVSRSIAKALDDLVRERMKGLVEEPDITSRIGQRLEDRFNGRRLGGYRVRVITETITSHGRKSLEKPLGTDFYFALSVEDAAGNRTSKGVLVQAKRERGCDWTELGEQCRRMRLVTKKESVVWLYRKTGIGVIRSTDVDRRVSASMDSTAFFDLVLECKIGDRRKTPPGPFGDRDSLKTMLKDLGAKNAVWLELDQVAG
ncbi:hypothetical protein ACIQC9_06665 [Brevundimonas sp. NPDC092305]|uniref:hypothetical protein n=1 Tax=Brevundimonas sp. NPDC092305 TaxID=3363957 RepID=UPI003818D40E